MGGVIPVSKFRTAFRVVPIDETGVPRKRTRMTAEEESNRRNWADQQLKVLMARKDLGREHCGVIDHNVVSAGLIRPYLIESAKAHGVKLRFQLATLTSERTNAMHGTSGNVTLVSLS